MTRKRGALPQGKTNLEMLKVLKDPIQGETARCVFSGIVVLFAYKVLHPVKGAGDQPNHSKLRVR